MENASDPQDPPPTPGVGHGWETLTPLAKREARVQEQCEICMFKRASEKSEELQIVREILAASHSEVMPKGKKVFKTMLLPIMKTAMPRLIPDINLTKVRHRQQTLEGGSSHGPLQSSTPNDASQLSSGLIQIATCIVTVRISKIANHLKHASF